MNALIDWGRSALRFLRHCRLYVGRDPGSVEAPALIFCPLMLATLPCGLAGILSLRRQGGPEPPGEPLEKGFGRAAGKNLAALLEGRIGATEYLGGRAALDEMERALLRLKGEEAFGRIFFDAAEARGLTDFAARLRTFLAAEDALLDEKAGCLSTADLESVNGGLVVIRDLLWGLTRDLLDNVPRIVALAGAEEVGGVDPAALPKYRKINSLLNCLDRLEVRGRDSAGLEISFVPADAKAAGEMLSRLAAEGFGEELRRRMGPGDLICGSFAYLPGVAPGEGRGAAPALCFTYKTASVVGELGRNVRELRAQIARDRLLQAFARLPVAFETAFAHTRWASVGSITEENCHPVSNFTLPAGTPGGGVPEKRYPAYGTGPWTIHVALNGDIDNYPALREELEAAGVSIAPEVTTDTKIIPLRVEHYLGLGHDLTEAFRLAVGDFAGSHAIAMVSNVEPGKVFLALKGSGQAIYVGMAPDRTLFSSELYGLVEETPYFVKMDGEKPAHADRPETNGQVLVLDQSCCGGTAGLKGFFYDGTPLTLTAADIRKAEITTRDIDRSGYPHFFLKEITESAHSVRKTLRGRYRIEQDRGTQKVVFNLGDDVIPGKIRADLAGGVIRRIVIIGQGTAAVAGSAVAEGMQSRLGASGIVVEAKVATELSGFGLRKDLHDTLVIPITQSGTTTDTNRAVAMAAERGASVIAIVNRRQSDITAKADGVLYTSDGRDIEMAVASTKAFYSQIVAGRILALQMAQILGTLSDERIAKELRRLEQAPELMQRVLARKEEIRSAAEKFARHKRYWAVVGSGPNKAAADEIRIKLSELCYKTISSDIVENKKHIDLSAEPLIVVCAAGNPEVVTADVVKDVAIFKAHRSSVIVFAEEGEGRFDAIADAVIPIPKAALPLPVILNTVAGHLFGYYAARCIDEEALFLRAFRSRLDRVIVEQVRRNLTCYESIADGGLRRLVGDFMAQFNARRNGGGFSWADVRTMSDLVLLLKYAAGKLPLDDFRHDFPEAEAGGSPIALLDVTLGRAVDELSRPIDAIRHQAKTVTVGTSRRETPLTGVLFDMLRKLDFSTRSLASANVLEIHRIQRAVAAVNGHTLYAVDHLDGDGKPGEAATIVIADRGGISIGMPSRAETSGRLMGTKKNIVATGRLYVGRGRSDGAPIVIMPLLDEDDWVGHLLLLHVTFDEALSIPERKAILGEKAESIRDLIQEYNLPWDERILGGVPLEILLGEPAEVIAVVIRKKKEST